MEITFSIYQLKWMSIIEVDADEAIRQVEEERLKSPKLTALLMMEGNYTPMISYLRILNTCVITEQQDLIAQSLYEHRTIQHKASIE
jgi:hypothetical protein